MREGKISVAALYKELALQHNRSDLLTVLSEYERVRVNDYVGLGFVGEVEECLEEDTLSNAGNGEKDCPRDGKLCHGDCMTAR